MRKLALLFVLAIGCGGDDGGGSQTPDAAIDAPTGTACTGAVYDPCTDNTQCMSNMCRVFGSAGIQVCTESCTPGTACPMAGGVAVTCNNMGFCRPPAANACTRQVW